MLGLAKNLLYICPQKYAFIFVFKQNFQVNKFMDMIKHLRGIALMLVGVALIFGSCKDPYIYDDKEPDWLGASIYDYLKEHKDANGKPDFTYYVRIIDACNYDEVLGRTGSKTMFVCDDAKFEEYFANNDDGITCFEDFTPEMLRQIMEYSMVNEANLIETMSYGPDYVPGQVMRRATALDPLDQLAKESGESLPDNNKYFEKFRKDGIFILNDNTSPRLVQFFEAHMAENGITDEDFSILFNGATRQSGDAHLFNRKVIERDITCKNGYIHVLDGLLLPEQNMSQFIRGDEKLTTFNRLMDRFTAPYADVNLTTQYVALNTDIKDNSFVQPENGFKLGDTIYVRRYLSNLSSGSVANDYDPNNQQVPANERLHLDPNWNSYQYGGNANGDMAAMFVPSNEAMDAYFSPNPDAKGNFLYKRYGEWDSVPNDIAALFLNAHMKYSFMASLPSKFDGLKNESLDEMFVNVNDVERTKVATNGVVYVTNNVYPPVELSSVMAPVLVREDTRIFNYPVNSSNGMGFDIYLKSMESKYNPGVVPPYTFIVPLDNAFENYIYPAAQGYDYPEMLCFEYNKDFQTVQAVRYLYDEETGQRGAMVTPSESAVLTTTEMGKINEVVKVYLNDMMDYHIIVGEVTPEQKYYQTKGKGFVYVDYDGTNNYTFYGGGNMEQNKKWSASQDQFDEQYASKGVEAITFENGKTIFIDKVMQQPLTSVYGMMSNVPEFKTFLDCMVSLPDVFIRTSGSGNNQWNAIDRFLNLFTAYHYTVYVPSNEVMQKAFAAGLPTPEQIRNTANATTKKRMQDKLLNFIKYHIQDNSVYIQGEWQNNTRFETALRNPLTGRFYSLYVTQDGENISLYPAVARQNGMENIPGTVAAGAENHRDQVNVVKTHNNYNLMTRDQILVGRSLQDVKGSPNDWSARAVVHEIDNYLSVIKPPVMTLGSDRLTPASAATMTFSVTDTGDGVVFDGSGDNAVITERGLCWALDTEPVLGDNNFKVFTAKSDLAEVRRQTIKFADMECIKSYFDASGNYNGTEVAPGDSILQVRAYALSKWADDGTAMATGKTPMMGYSDALRFNWVTGVIVKNDE